MKSGKSKNNDNDIICSESHRPPLWPAHCEGSTARTAVTCCTQLCGVSQNRQAQVRNAGEGPCRPSFPSSGVLLSSQFYLLQLDHFFHSVCRQLATLLTSSSLQVTLLGLAVPSIRDFCLLCSMLNPQHLQHTQARRSQGIHVGETLNYYHSLPMLDE